MTIVELLDVISKGGVIGLLLIIVVGGYRGWFVYGPQHDRQVSELMADRDFWRRMALGNLRIAERAAEAVDAPDE